MTTPRKQVSTIVLDHLSHADNALAAATALHEQALQQQARDITAMLERVTGKDGRDLLIRQPDYVISLLEKMRRYHTESMALHWQAQAFEEKAKRLITQAQNTR